MASAPESMGLRQRRNTNTLHSGQTFPMSMLPSQVANGTNLGDTDEDYLLGTPSRTSGETDVETLSGRSLRDGGAPVDEEQTHDEDDSPLVRPGQLKHSATDSATTPPGARDDTRKPKHITRRGPFRYLHGWIVHVPAVLATIAVLVVGKMRIYWYPETGPVIGNSYRLDAEIISNVLQLAAKIHELLIVASLSSIVLAMSRRRLITDGVRLGFLTGSYRVGDLGYLGTAAFWRQGLNTLKPWEILLSGFLVFSTIMSTIVGPASAVLLIPTLDWYGFGSRTAFETIQLPVFYLRDQREVWTRVYAETNHLKKYMCNTEKGILTSHCPGGGFTGMSKWVTNHPTTELRNNLTFSATSADIRRHVVFTQSKFTADAAHITLSTTAPQCVLDSIGLLQHYINDAADGSVGAVSHESRYRLQTTATGRPSNSTQLYQPFVQSRCKIYNMELGNKLEYPREDFECFTDRDCEDRMRDPMPYNKTLAENDGFKNRSVVLNYGTHKDNSSVIFLSGVIPNTTEGRPTQVLYMCTQTANWVPSNFSVDSGASDVLHSNLSDGKRMQKTYEDGSANVLPIHFNKTWSKYANPSWNDSEPTTFSYLYRLVQSFSLKEEGNGTAERYMALSDPSNTTAIEVFLAKVFGGHLADALARSSFNQWKVLKLDSNSSEIAFIDLRQTYSFRGSRHRFTPNGTDLVTDEWGGYNQTLNRSFEEAAGDFRAALPINITAERYGYGTGQGQERKTVRFARAMLLIYLGAVAIYVAAIAVCDALDYLESRQTSRVQSVIPWTDLQELFVLGLRTTPPPPPRDEDLVDAGAGVSDTRIWEKVIAARADDGDNVQLVFRETPSARLDLTGKKQYF
ncbi:hypothetical protein CSHISOI_09721 [Colletotrichum shisoi]|uniref:Uncharacterized protein n=1 Tax=Colletotrichum shisoi TaxID=2078593 RepID=A0A5Q4BGD9_9PEZI|nr:hypothetical protein CSHISOI_09721 [Colletotrichum shisoi]